MAKTIPQLTDATTVNAADELIVSQGGVTKRATATELFSGTATVTSTGSTTGRTLKDRFADTINVKDFGAVGDGTTDDTAAIQAAIDAAAGRHLIFPSGTYIVSYLSYKPTSNIPIAISGAGTNSTILKRTGSSSNPVLDIGSSPSPAFITHVQVSDLTIDGLNKSGRACLRTLDCWYLALRNLRLINSEVGLEMLTPIFVDAQSITASNNDVGINISYYTGGSFPNSQPGVVTLSNCVFIDNTSWGLKFDDGTTLVLRNCAIENSGTTIGASDQGGIWVGPNVGRFNVGTTTPGVSLYDCHFEGNKGIAGVHILSGRSILQNVFFWESPSGTTNDIRIEGGFYSIYNVTCASTKSPNLLEAVGVGIGNIISQSKIDSITINEAKTTVSNAPSLKLPFVTIGGSQGPTAALTFQNASTYWDVKQLASTSFGVYNGALLAAYWDASRNFSPGADNQNSLGKAPDRWSQLFAGTGSISTSDAQYKQQVSLLSPAEKSVASEIKGLIKRYKFVDAVEHKGENARWHFGVLAQDVKDAFEKNGLNAADYGLFCYDQWNERQEIVGSDGNIEVPYRPAGSIYGIRYEELLSFLHAASE